MTKAKGTEKGKANRDEKQTTAASRRGGESVQARASRTGPIEASLSYPTSAGNSPSAENASQTSGPAIRATTANETGRRSPKRKSKVTDIESYRRSRSVRGAAGAAPTEQVAAKRRTKNTRRGAQRGRKAS